MTPQFTLLGQVLTVRARDKGDKTALRSATDTMTYAELRDRAARTANGLVEAGIRPGDRIAYLAKNSAAYYELLFGAAAAGAVLVPLNWRLTPTELAWLLEDCGAVALFADQELHRETCAVAVHMPGMRLVVAMAGDGAAPAYAEWRDSFPDGFAEVPASPDDVVVQIYTSGTTGKPKGAMLSHRALLVFRSISSEQQPEWNRWTDDDVSLIVSPQFHIGGTGFGLQTLCAGATGLVLTEFDAGRVLEAIEREGLSKMFLVPSAIQMLLAHPRVRSIDYRRIRTIVYGASPIPPELLRDAIRVFDCGFVQQYGMTEACGTIAVLPPEDHHPDGNERMRSAGKALPDVDIRILDAEGRPLPAGEIGEIAIRSPTLMRGYWRLPEATAQVMTPDGFFLSGDAGLLDADGYLFILDRLKDMIVSGGENVYPAEVEIALADHPSVAEVAVIGVPDAKWGEAVKAIVVPAPGASEDASAIINWARSHLAGYKLPKSIDFVEALPRNATGKVLRRALRDPYWADSDRKVN